MIFCSIYPTQLIGVFRQSQICLRESLEVESYCCIYCNKEVTARQEVLLCDGCDKRQHRRCNTGIARQQYRSRVQNLMDRLVSSEHFAPLHTIAKTAPLGAEGYKSHNRMPLITLTKREMFSCSIPLDFSIISGILEYGSYFR